jgi:hypothetical protein
MNLTKFEKNGENEFEAHVHIALPSQRSHS